MDDLFPVSEFEYLTEDLMNQASSIVVGLFKDFRFCRATGFNLKKTKVSSFFADKTAKEGIMEWAIDLSPLNVHYKKTAYVLINFDADSIYTPVVFRDNLSNTKSTARGFTEKAVMSFLFAGTDPTQYSTPAMPTI